MKTIDLNQIAEDELLSLRIRDLPLRIEGTWLRDCIDQVYKELEAKAISFKPECYLADEWLTPENQPVIGIPFYLAHPALIRLEKKMMLEAEGESVAECMRLLRHETGHALCYAYRLNRKQKFRRLFGSSSAEYAETYRFRPYSKRYVRHLEGFYAQYHPDEDFVETFAVWLTPGLDWQAQYRGWPALKKLQYVDEVMRSISGKQPFLKKGKKFWRFKSIKRTLRSFYQKKQRLRAEDFPDFHDNNLRRIFGDHPPDTVPKFLAADFLRQHRNEIIREISLWTGEKKYVVNDLLKKVSQRCRDLRLAVHQPEHIVMMRVVTYLTTLILNYLYTGWYRGDHKRRGI